MKHRYPQPYRSQRDAAQNRNNDHTTMSMKILIIKTDVLILAFVLAVANASTFQRTANANEPGDHALSLQGGWWHIEGEARWKLAYASLGVPWAALLLPVDSGVRWIVPLHGNIGAQLHLNPRVKLRAGARSVWIHQVGHHADAEHSSDKTYELIEIGVRYESPQGFVAGVQVPVYGLENWHELFSHQSARVKQLAPPITLAFSQVYAGYSWRF